MGDPLVMTNIAIENGHRNSEFPIKSMVIFHRQLCKRLAEGIWKYVGTYGNFFMGNCMVRKTYIMILYTYIYIL